MEIPQAKTYINTYTHNTLNIMVIHGMAIFFIIAEVIWVILPNTSQYAKFLSLSMPGTGICKNHKIRGISTKTNFSNNFKCISFDPTSFIFRFKKKKKYIYIILSPFYEFHFGGLSADVPYFMIFTYTRFPAC